jgi:protein-disulfide isomerase
MQDESRAKDGLTLSPKMSFVLGLIGGIMVLCTIGFFILLSVVLKGSFSPNIDSTDKSEKVAVNEAAAPTAPVGDPSVNQVGDVAPVTSADHIRGSSSAAVTLVEYSDLQCPYCANFHATMKQLMADSAYKSKVRWVFRHFPLSFHPNAEPAALAAECASEQGKFWEFADKVYENQADMGDALYTKLAGDLGLNKTKFDACIKDKKYQSAVDADYSSGGAAGITGTPGTIIMAKDGSKTLIPGALPIESVKQMIDTALGN